MTNGHTFKIDMSELLNQPSFDSIRDQMLLRIIFEIANEANKSGLDGERLVNLRLDRYPDFGPVVEYEITFETEPDRQVIANRSLPSGE